MISRQLARFPSNFVRKLRTNSGGEYIVASFKKYLVEHQIEHETTIPHTPEQNGVVERANQTINNYIRALMIESSAPADYWPDALNMALYIRNRLPNTILGHKSPFEVIIGVAPKIATLPSFFAERWICLPQADKVGPRAIKVRVLHPAIDVNGKKAFMVQKVEDKGRKGRLYAYNFLGPRGAQRLNKEHEAARAKSLEVNEEGSEAGTESTMSTVEWTSLEEEKLETDDVNEINTCDPDVIHKISTSKLTVTKSGRTTRPPGCLKPGANVAQQATSKIDPNSINPSGRGIPLQPKSMKDALKTEYKDEWKAAGLREIQRFKQHNVYEEVPWTKDLYIAGSKWVIKIKWNLDGTPKVFRAWLVVQGFSLEPGRDFEEPTCSVPLSQAGLKVGLTILAIQDMNAVVFDIKSAYLHGWLQKPFYMKAPEGFEKIGLKGKPLMWKVQKSLYGHPATGYVWKETLANWFETVEMYETNPGKMSIFLGKKNGKLLMLCLYVNDCLLAGPREEIEMFLDQFTDRFAISGIEKLNHNLLVQFIGHEIKRDRLKKACKLTQLVSIDKGLKAVRTWTTNFRASSTPMQTSVKYVKEDHPQVREHEYETPALFQSIVGMLGWISSSRPNIAFAYSVLSRLQREPIDQN